MDKLKDYSHVNELFESIFEAITDDHYYVAERIGDKLLINEKNLNQLTPELLQKLFSSKGIKIEVSEEFCVDFILHLLKKADSVLKVYEFFNKSKSRRGQNISIKEKMIGIDFEIGGPNERSTYLQLSFQKLGFQATVDSYRSKYFQIFSI